MRKIRNDRGKIRKSLVGKRFGRLTVINISDKPKASRCYWECLCDCGKVISVMATSLYTNHTKSCGCLKHDSLILDFGRSSMNALYNRYTLGAKKRNHQFELTFQQFIELTSSKCYYCGYPPRNKYKHTKNSHGHYLSNGIDRIDNNKGYSLDNCLPCCKTCNYAKREMSFQEFINWIEVTYMNLKTKRITNL